MILSVGLSSCEARGPFGLTEPAFRGILDRGDRASLLALPAQAFDNPGPAGPPAWYFTALWLLEDEPRHGGDGRSQGALFSESVSPNVDLALNLLARASKQGQGFVRDDARRRQVKILAEAARTLPPGPESHAAWENLLAASTAPDAGQEVETARLEALAALGSWPELLAAANSLLNADIDKPSSTDQAALYARCLAASRLGLAGTAKDLGDLLAFGQGPWVAKALDLAAEPENAGLVPDLFLAKARLYQAIEARDYAAAYRASLGALPELRASPTRALVGAFGKAWLFSGMSKEGLDLMDSVAAAGGSEVEGGSPAWTALFYKARMLIALSRPEEATTILLSLGGSAISEKDMDSCFYYALDARLKSLDKAVVPVGKWASKALRDRALAEARLEAIETSASRWSDPTTYTDLIEPLFRDLVAEGDWDEADSFASRLIPFASPFLASRLLYVSARARELGLVDAAPSLPMVLLPAFPPQFGPARQTDGVEAKARFEKLVSLGGAPGYYILVASARLGIDIRPWQSGASPFRFKLFEPTEGAHDLAATLRSLVDFGLPGIAWDLANGSSDAVDDEDLAELSKESARAGSFVSSMRFANSLAARSGSGYDGLSKTMANAYLPSKELYELLYPRPWRRELGGALSGSDIPESAAYGLIRSESWFDPAAKSGAGAVGLTQLMPTTAAEIARDLKIRMWSLVLPEDNLRLGMAMLHDLFDENDGHLLRAAFAYNAGRGRLRRWLAESGGYPDDLFLERLSIAETRDYGRKIVGATAWYAALYYGKGSAETVRELIAGYPTGK